MLQYGHCIIYHKHITHTNVIIELIKHVAVLNTIHIIDIMISFWYFIVANLYAYLPK